MSKSQRLIRFCRLYFGALVLSACSVGQESAGIDGPTAKNQCSGDSACADGVCQNQMCVALSGDLRTLLFEVTPPAGAGSLDENSGGTRIAGVRFTQVVRQIDEKQGELHLTLGFVSKIRGTVRAAPVATEACVAGDPLETAPLPSEDGTLPARVTLIPRERLLGLPNPVHTTAAALVDGAYRFALEVPPGDYDVFVEPLGGDPDCVRSPYLVVGQRIPAQDVELNITLPVPDSLAVRVRWPSNADELTGWTIDIVERDAGRLLSNRVVLGDPVETANGIEYLAGLAFSGVSGDTKAQVAEIVRLSPPTDRVAPTIFIERSVVELFQGGEGLIDQINDLPTAVRLAGQVNRQGQTAAVPSTVTVIATSIAGVNAGTVAAFSRTVTSDQDGSFEVELLPGEYRVLVEPVKDGQAATEQRLTVSPAATSQAGWVFEVPTQGKLTGKMLDYGGSALEGILVQATSPSPSFAGSVIDLARGEGNLQPRAIGVASGVDGSFELFADPGRFDVVAQSQDTSGFPWAVRLEVSVSSEGKSLGSLRMPLPQVLVGSLVSEDIGIVPSALIRAYAYVRMGKLTAEPSEATSVVPVAETRVDSDGNYRLLLPSTFK